MQNKLKDYTFLIIDDDEGLNNLIRKKLNRINLNCMQAFSGNEALEIIKNESKNFILILDYMLLDMNSKELILTFQEKGYNLPFIAMTGQGNQEIAVDLFKLGAKDYLAKDTEFLNLLPDVVLHVLDNQIKDEKLAIANDEIKFLSSITKQTSDSIITTDLNFNITFSNNAAQKLYGYTEQEYLSLNFKKLLSRDFLSKNKNEMTNIVKSGGCWELEEENIKKNQNIFICHIKITPLFINDVLESFIFVIRDITEKKEQEEEREKLISELTDAMGKIKTLKGLIPICAGCKKVRSDDDYWEEVEIYIRDRSEADFTHGLCPDCTRDLYPEIYKKLKKEGKL